MRSYCQQCREERVANEGDLCSTCEMLKKMTPEERADRAAAIARFLSTKIPRPPTASAHRPVKSVFSADDRRRPGPKPKGPERHFEYERVYNLRRSGLSFGEIAKEIWNDPSKRNLASANYQRAIKSGFPPIKPSGK
jgi:hypothetical protein